MEVLVIDDHPITTEVLRMVSASAFERCVTHIAEDLQSSLKLAENLAGDALVLLDLLLPGYRDIEALTYFQSRFPHLRVVVVSAVDDPRVVRRALEAGAAGYIPKTTNANTMAAVLRLVATGAIYMPAEVFIGVRHGGPTAIRLAETLGTGRFALTESQLRILRLVCAGYRNKEIARQLSISNGTVKQHLHAIYEKLGASTRSEAVITAVRHGLISEEMQKSPKSAA